MKQRNGQKKNKKGKEAGSSEIFSRVNQVIFIGCKVVPRKYEVGLGQSSSYPNQIIQITDM